MSAAAVSITLPVLLRSSSAPSSPVDSTPKSIPDTMSIRQFGTIEWYNEAQGFGMITSEFGGSLILRSSSSIPMGTLREGMRVSYEAVQGPVLLMADQRPLNPPIRVLSLSPLQRTHVTNAAPKRQFPTTGFVKLDLSRKIEEEDLPCYKAENYYPASIGQVLESIYQIVSKLGYGTSSTVWLCRDLLQNGYFTIKVCNKGHKPSHGLAVSALLKSAKDHAGKKTVRLVLDSFEVSGPSGTHTCLVYQPCGMSFTEFQNLLPDNKVPKELAQRGIQLVLISLAFLHDNGVIHTDISTNNILQGIQDPSMLRQIEDDEVSRPIARKVLSDRTIYFSRPMPNSVGLPDLSDFGEARIEKGSNRGDIMPGIYRAPEVILDMEWDCKVDVWSIGTMIWDMVESGHLFFAKKDRILNDEQHLAEMVSLMGPPPLEFLQRSEKCRQFWDDQGTWKGSIPVPEQSFEMRARQFSGEDNELFIAFLRRIFRWLPEERPTAEELAYDDFLMQPLLAARLAG